jgi:hypothetical protein
MSVQYLNLDEIIESNKKVLQFKGVDHELQPIDLDTFIENVKIVEALGTSPTFEAELGAVVTMLKKAFPTIDEEDLRKVPLKALNQILAFAQGNDGTDEVKQEAAQANPPTAA